jgi:transcriptional regulator with XRE-family HTH domain
MKKSEEVHSAAFCRRLRDAAGLRGMTASRLAKEADVSVRQIIDYFGEKPSVNPRAITVGSLARALGVRYEWLARGEDPRELPQVICEPAGRYDRSEESPASNGDVPLHQLIELLAAHLGCPREEILDFVLHKMKGKRP